MLEQGIVGKELRGKIMGYKRTLNGITAIIHGLFVFVIVFFTQKWGYRFFPARTQCPTTVNSIICRGDIINIFKFY